MKKKTFWTCFIAFVFMLSGCTQESSKPVKENESVSENHEKETTEQLVKIDGVLYHNTGNENTIEGRCGVMDGEVVSTVDKNKIPNKDNQSNFGKYEYQIVMEGQLEFLIDGKWMIFEQCEDK